MDQVFQRCFQWLSLTWVLRTNLELKISSVLENQLLNLMKQLNRLIFQVSMIIWLLLKCLLEYLKKLVQELDISSIKIQQALLVERTHKWEVGDSESLKNHLQEDLGLEISREAMKLYQVSQWREGQCEETS